MGIEPLIEKDRKFLIGPKKGSFGVLFLYYMDYYKEKGFDEQKDIFFITNSSLDNKQRLFNIFNPAKIPSTKEQIQKELVNHSEKNFFLLI